MRAYEAHFRGIDSLRKHPIYSRHQRLESEKPRELSHREEKILSIIALVSWGVLWASLAQQPVFSNVPGFTNAAVRVGKTNPVFSPVAGIDEPRPLFLPVEGWADDPVPAVKTNQTGPIFSDVSELPSNKSNLLGKWLAAKLTLSKTNRVVNSNRVFAPEFSTITTWKEFKRTYIGIDIPLLEQMPPEIADKIAEGLDRGFGRHQQDRVKNGFSRGGFQNPELISRNGDVSFGVDGETIRVDDPALTEKIGSGFFAWLGDNDLSLEANMGFEVQLKASKAQPRVFEATIPLDKTIVVTGKDLVLSLIPEDQVDGNELPLNMRPVVSMQFSPADETMPPSAGFQTASLIWRRSSEDKYLFSTVITPEILNVSAPHSPGAVQLKKISVEAMAGRPPLVVKVKVQKQKKQGRPPAFYSSR